MPAMPVKLVFPWGIVLVLSLAVWYCFPGPRTASRFEDILQRIQNIPAADFEAPRRDADEYIQFQAHALNPMPGTPDAGRVAELYFQLGEAILSRPDSGFLPVARDHFLRAAALYPPLRQGWLYFQIGRTLELTGPPFLEEAQSYYSLVSIYNPGRLALLAGYRVSLIGLRIQPEPLDPQPLYNYVRFYSRDVESDLAPFAEAEFTGREEGEYLNALLAFRVGNKEKAAGALDRYLALRPSDPSAAYYRDRIAGRALQAMYPADGDLLKSCYAPKAYRDGFFYLPHDGNILTDLYGSAPENHALAVTLRLEKPWAGPARISVTLNNDTRTVLFQPEESRKEQGLVFRFDTPRERNLLQCHVFMESGGTVWPQPQLIHVRSLKAGWIPRETAR